MSEIHEIDGYTFGVDKLDRRLDPYMGWVRNPLGYTYTGLFATEGKALSWCRRTVQSDKAAPREPLK